MKKFTEIAVWFAIIFGVPFLILYLATTIIAGIVCFVGWIPFDIMDWPTWLLTFSWPIRLLLLCCFLGWLAKIIDITIYE